MKLSKDILKTIGAVLIIGVIVVATFLYGNKQRQDQVARDNQLKSQQSAQTTQPAPSASGQVATASPSTSPGTDAVKSTDQAGNINQNTATQTAPAATPAPAAKPTPTPAPTAPVAQTPAQAPATTPTSGGTDQAVGGGTIPDTGGELYYLVPSAALLLLWGKSRRRQSDLRRAIIGR